MVGMPNPYAASILGSLCAAALFAAAGCGSSGSSASSAGPTSPTTTPTGAVATTTIRIAGNVATPKDIIVARGSQVTFINNDSVSHNMASDPHPDHTDCPEINQVGFLSAGQSRQTGNMVTNRAVCGFHDHDLPNVAGLQGTISIQ
jgi:plastocyanin